MIGPVPAASLTGWRYFVMGTEPPMWGKQLTAPFQATPWLPGRDFHAQCARTHFDRNHVPPAKGCECGVFAYANVVDARWRMRVDHRNRRETYARKGHPFFPVFVLGRLTLYDVVEFAGQVSALMWNLGGCDSARSMGVELRAGRARIEELFIYEDGDLPRMTVVAAQLLLSGSWDVPVTVGEPGYTEPQWRGKQFGNRTYEQVGLFSPAAV
jgi:hypothetical protein